MIKKNVSESKDYLFGTVPFELKDYKETEEYFEFEGFASTKDIDLVDDIVMPEAFRGSIGQKTKLYWQHNREEPLGIFIEKEIRENGLFVRGRMPKSDTFVTGRVIPQMKVGSIDSMSIGFITKKANYDTDTNIRIITELDLREISLVTEPAQPNALITAMKAHEKIEAMKEGTVSMVSISKEDLGDLSLSEIKFAIRRGLLSKDAASFVSEIVIGKLKTRESGGPDDKENEKFLIEELGRIFREK